MPLRIKAPSFRRNPMLTLKRASKSRPSGQWSDDDYDVFDGDGHTLALK